MTTEKYTCVRVLSRHKGVECVLHPGDRFKMMTRDNRILIATVMGVEEKGLLTNNGRFSYQDLSDLFISKQDDVSFKPCL